jgi:hypothetical protein
MTGKDKAADSLKEAALSRAARPTPKAALKLTQPTHPTVVLQRAIAAPRALSQSDILSLQQTFGNRAVQRLWSENAKHSSISANETGGAHPFSRAVADVSSDEIRQAAREGLQTPATKLPYAEQIQKSFGRYDVTGIQAHLGERATKSSAAMNARAYATGEHVIFAGKPSLHTAAHEAAHVVQQSGVVKLAGGVGRADDIYERHADAVAQRVAAGQSAEEVLAQFAARRDETKADVAKRRTAGGAPVQATVKARAGGTGDSSSLPIQRAVGFEFETRWQLQAEPVDQMGYASWIFSGAALGGNALTRNETLVKGNGWTMAPDTHAGNMVAEFKTNPVDENDANTLNTAMNDMHTYCQNLDAIGGATTLRQVAGASVVRHRKNTTIVPGAHPIDGRPQATGGVRLDRIIRLLEEMGQHVTPAHAGGERLLVNDPQVAFQSIFRTTTSAARRRQQAQGWSDTYTGLVALMSTYINMSYAYQMVNLLLPYWKPVAAAFNRTSMNTILTKSGGATTLLADILTVTRRVGTDAFPPTAPPANRTTIQAWVTEVINNQEVSWSDKFFKLERVGPSRYFSVLRHQGAPIELRGLEKPRRYQDWPQLAASLLGYFRALNA